MVCGELIAMKVYLVTAPCETPSTKGQSRGQVLLCNFLLL